MKLVPDVVAAERTTAVVEQLIVPPVALASGAVALALTDAIAVLVQPPAEVITVIV